MANEDLWLHPEGCLHWPRRRVLFFTDPHFGKADSFQAAGLALPERATQDDLDRLSRVIDRTRPARVLCLGDFLHARTSASPGVRAAIRRWRDMWSGLTVELLPGNHDRRAGVSAAAWGITVMDGVEHFDIGPFRCTHEPGAAGPGEPFRISGHLHPACRLGPGTQFPCLCIGEAGAVLPAFSSVVGFTRVPRRAWTSLVLLTPDGPVQIRGRREGS